MRAWTTVWNNLKGSGTEKEGKKRFKKKEGGKLGQGVGAIKRGVEAPYKLCST